MQVIEGSNPFFTVEQGAAGGDGGAQYRADGGGLDLALLRSLALMFLPRLALREGPALHRRAGGATPFPGVRPRAIAPTPGVIEHTVRAGDRLDLLARHYYNDDRLWWRIVDANPEFFYGGDLVREEEVGDQGSPPEPPRLESMVGRTILIPRARG